MNQLFSIALYTFREAIRNKILYSIVFFSIALILLAVFLGQGSLQQDARVIRNIGLTTTSLFSNVIGLFLGVTLVYQELERKTIYNVLSKPLTRPIYFFGKFLGVMLTLALQLIIMSAVLTFVLIIRGDATPPALFYSYWLILMEATLVVAVAFFFSSFSTPYVSGYLTLGVWMVGRLVQELIQSIPDIEAAGTRKLVSLLTAVCPDLSLFTLQTQLSLGISVPMEYVLHVTTYGLGYAIVALIGGAFLFQRRDFI
jgi:ABC-type transport system involved in multi-copper enzyme maturation permease subunit